MQKQPSQAQLLKKVERLRSSVEPGSRAKGRVRSIEKEGVTNLHVQMQVFINQVQLKSDERQKSVCQRSKSSKVNAADPCKVGKK